MLRVAGKPVGERLRKAPPFRDVALADANLHRGDRMQHRGMFVNVAFTRGKVGLLHPGVLDAKMLARVQREAPQIRLQVRVGAGLDQADERHQLAVFVVHRAEAQQVRVVPGDGRGCDRCVCRHGQGFAGGADFHCGLRLPMNAATPSIPSSACRLQVMVSPART